MRYLKTLIVASSLSLGASAVMAAGAGGISTGLSGSSAGMISEGGKAAFNLDAKAAGTDARDARDARASAGSETRKPHSSSRRSADAYAKADEDEGQSKARTKSKKKKKTYVKSWGFTSFGYSGQQRMRYRSYPND